MYAAVRDTGETLCWPTLHQTRAITASYMCHDSCAVYMYKLVCSAVHIYIYIYIYIYNCE